MEIVGRLPQSEASQVPDHSAVDSRNIPGSPCVVTGSAYFQYSCLAESYDLGFAGLKITLFSLNSLVPLCFGDVLGPVCAFLLCSPD